MKVLIKIKKGLSLKDMFNRSFTKYRREFIDYEPRKCDKRVYINKNVGLTFIREDDLITPYRFQGLQAYWEEMLFNIYNSRFLKKIILEILKKILNDETIKSCKNLLLDSFLSNVEIVNEFEWLLNNNYFYLLDEKKNIFVLVNGKFHLLVRELFFTVSNGELIISNEEKTLKEYLTPIYKIKNGYHFFETDTFEQTKEYFENNSKLVYNPVIEEKVERTKFYSPSLLKTNYDVSFEDFINSLEFTNYNRLVLTYKLMSALKNDSCKEYEYKKGYKENNEVYTGLAQSIRYIKENDLTVTNNIMDGTLKFTYVKKVDVLVLESLPKINDIFVLNEAVLKIILEMLYNVTDLENIKEIHISNKLIGPVVISNKVLENFPSLASVKHYALALKSEETLKEIYNNETSRRKALDLKRKKERRILVTTVNHNKERYKKDSLINENGGDIISHVTAYKIGNKTYKIIYHGHKTKEFVRSDHYRSTQIIEAPEIIDIDKDNLNLKGFVISFPKGTKEIKNFSIKGELNPDLLKYFSQAKQGTIETERHLFIVLPSTLDLKTFEFFKMVNSKHLIFISDNIKFIEEFRYRRRIYNRDCDSKYHFNAPIVYDRDIYDKIWGYRSNSNSLYEDLKERIQEEQKRITEERTETEEYRFFNKKELNYCKDDLTEEDIKRFYADMNAEDIIHLLLKQRWFHLFSCEFSNIEKIILFEKGVVKKFIINTFLNDNELLNAINFNDISRISDNHIENVFNRYLGYFNSEQKLMSYVFKVFNELVEQKQYYELIFRRKELRPLSWGSGYFDDFKFTKARIEFNDFYSIANTILFSEDLVRSINIGDILTDYLTIGDELNKINRDNCIPLILYVFDLLRKSGIYFKVGESVPKEFIDTLIENFPYNEEYYKQLLREYIYKPRKILQIK